MTRMFNINSLEQILFAIGEQGAIATMEKSTTVDNSITVSVIKKGSLVGDFEWTIDKTYKDQDKVKCVDQLLICLSNIGLNVE